jgi:hypothetical protein
MLIMIERIEVKHGWMQTEWQGSQLEPTVCFHFETALRGKASEKNGPIPAYSNLLGEPTYSEV